MNNVAQRDDFLISTYTKNRLESRLRQYIWQNATSRTLAAQRWLLHQIRHTLAGKHHRDALLKHIPDSRKAEAHLLLCQLAAKILRETASPGDA